MKTMNIEDVIEALLAQADEMTLIVRTRNGQFRRRCGLMVGLDDSTPDELVLEFTEGDDECLDISDVTELCGCVDESDEYDMHHYQIHTNGEYSYSLDLICEKRVA